MYRCAIIGVGGPRARGHAEAYSHIERAQLIAVSTRNREKLDAFGQKFGIEARYTDYRQMLAQEKPDLVHVNTPPDVRLEIFAAAEEAKIPALIVEKPLAIQGEDFLAMQQFAHNCRIKIAVNHQLHFQPRRAALQRQVRDGAVGQVRFIDASAGMNMAYQGTHCLQAIAAFNPLGTPQTVFAQVAGSQGLDGPKQHFAPDQCLAAIHFDNGVRAQLLCGPHAPQGNRQGIHTHKRVAVYGTQGYLHWSMWDWETNIDGQMESGEHDYGDEDLLGQAAMTEAMFDWIEDEGAVHALNLTAALQDFNTMLGMYTSALKHQVIKLPVHPDPGIIDALRRRLAEGAVG